MAIIGEVIKGAIKIAGSLIEEKDHVKAQQKTLIKLLKTAQSTDFGKYYKFSEILNQNNIHKSFINKIPYFDYDKINKEWWSKMHEGKTNVTWPGESKYFALSSGTTGKESKRIPISKAMLDAITKAGLKQVLSLKNFDLSADFFQKDILMLGSSTNLNQRNDNKLEGEISGITAANIPFWFQSYYKPGEEISKIDDWDKRVEHIVKHAKTWDVGALSGIPSWIELMLEEIIEYYNLNHIHEIWPNLQVYTSGGVAFGPYEKSFEALTGKTVQVIDTYLASEGYIATQVRPETHAMQLNTDNGIYFEFVPFQTEYIDENGALKPNAPSFNLDEVEKGNDYVLVMSTVAGAWRYMIGDTIQFTDIERAEIKITGRTKFFLNTVGSQLSVNKMDDAMRELEQQFNTEIREYTIAAVKDEHGDFYHHWYLGTMLNRKPIEVAQALDDSLKNANKNYKVARTKALKGVKVDMINPELFYDWNAHQKKKGGQVKMERVMGEEKFREWREFVSSKRPKYS
ncbi:GH3 family domain-containing protein [Mesohalobacter halotolerans]|uniref:GH3 auxin-responsive promoter family protein n=1 Tax=Mesohalobacter halotolerans TaxID=1883405 RepID=A0A4U5TNR5_9FLAO|nr:GH3 auxin-responsive promoter family protein [Mesohalobacter halotolerans]MBS3737612.1 GH3 auxin-responsive promoter family protein [Psychroflexus sp.]TKS55442.1 GH3 auxin-responsive promoter family protein [Mesohalobacter halotolerans]